MRYVIASMLFLLSFQPKQLRFEKKGFTETQIDTSTYAVIKYNPAMSNLFEGEVKSASLSPEELVKIDEIIMKGILQYNQQSKQIAKSHGKQFYGSINPNSKRYKQVISVMNRSSQKEVWVNCFCHKPTNNSDWKNKIVMVLDGGNCYFQLKINLTTSAVLGFSVNGSA